MDDKGVVYIFDQMLLCEGGHSRSNENDPNRLFAKVTVATWQHKGLGAYRT